MQYEHYYGNGTQGTSLLEAHEGYSINMMPRILCLRLM